MRCPFRFVCALTMVISPLSVSAQDAEEATAAEPNAAEPATSSDAAPEEPLLQLKLDEAGVEVIPSPPRAGYLKTDLRQARGWLGGSTILFAGGVAMTGAGFANIQFAPQLCFSEPCPETPAWAIPVATVGLALVAGGLAGMVVAGKRLARSKKQLRWYAGVSGSVNKRTRRARWDLARSQLVF